VGGYDHAAQQAEARKYEMEMTPLNARNEQQATIVKLYHDVSCCCFAA
jgi:hypothetical protein